MLCFGAPSNHLILLSSRFHPWGGRGRGPAGSVNSEAPLPVFSGPRALPGPLPPRRHRAVRMPSPRHLALPCFRTSHVGLSGGRPSLPPEATLPDAWARCLPAPGAGQPGVCGMDPGLGAAGWRWGIRTCLRACCCEGSGKKANVPLAAGGAVIMMTGRGPCF